LGLTYTGDAHLKCTDGAITQSSPSLQSGQNQALEKGAQILSCQSFLPVCIIQETQPAT